MKDYLVYPKHTFLQLGETTTLESLNLHPDEINKKAVSIWGGMKNTKHRANENCRGSSEKKTTPKNRVEQEIAGYRDVLNVIHESFDAILITKNYVLQLHKILYSHMNNPIAGQTKNLQNYISATYPDGHAKILFTPFAPF